MGAGMRRVRGKAEYCCVHAGTLPSGVAFQADGLAALKDGVQPVCGIWRAVAFQAVGLAALKVERDLHRLLGHHVAFQADGLAALKDHQGRDRVQLHSWHSRPMAWLR